MAFLPCVRKFAVLSWICNFIRTRACRTKLFDLFCSSTVTSPILKTSVREVGERFLVELSLTVKNMFCSTSRGCDLKEFS